MAIRAEMVQERTFLDLAKAIHAEVPSSLLTFHIRTPHSASNVLGDELIRIRRAYRNSKLPLYMVCGTLNTSRQ